MRYSIRWQAEAIGDLRDLGAFDQARILDEVDEQLLHEPTMTSRRRKRIDGLKPPWADRAKPFWQLRVEPFRVFYDVTEVDRTVIVRAVRRKDHGKTTEEIL